MMEKWRLLKKDKENAPAPCFYFAYKTKAH